MNKLTLINSNKQPCEVIANDIVRIDSDGFSVYLTGASLISILTSCEEWNTLLLDAKTGQKSTILHLLKGTRP